MIHTHSFHIPLHALTVLIEFNPLQLKVKLSELKLQVNALDFHVLIFQFIVSMIVMVFVMTIPVVTVSVMTAITVLVVMTISVMVISSVFATDCHPLGLGFPLRELTLFNGSLDGLHHF